MIKYIFIFLILIPARIFGVCYAPNIKDAYRISPVIFYGQFIETRNDSNFPDFYGRPRELEIFKIVKTYKGLDTATFNLYKKSKKNYLFSLISSCTHNEYEGAGFCFEKGKNYLVYAIYDSFEGYLIAGGCYRTREILNDNSFDNKEKVNEFDELSKLAKTDTSRFDFIAHSKDREISYHIQDNLYNFLRISNIINVFLNYQKQKTQSN